MQTETATPIAQEREKLLAHCKQIKTIALRGEDRSRLKQIADIAICIPGGNVQHIQEAHLAVDRPMTFVTEQQLYGENAP